MGLLRSEAHDTMMVREAWVTYCVNYEHQQRRQALRDTESVYPGNEFEIGDLSGECGLASTEEHFEEWDQH